MWYFCIVLFSRPGQSQGLLYKHCCHPLINQVRESPFSSHGCKALACQKLHRLKTFLISKEIKIASLVQKLRRFDWIGRFCLLVELHWEGSARSQQSGLVKYSTTYVFLLYITGTKNFCIVWANKFLYCSNILYFCIVLIIYTSVLY